MRKTNQNGFTFIEMLMVFAVISILVMMFIPSVHRMREKGRQATCITNQRQLAVAALLYANECRDFLPLSLAQLEESDYIIQTLDQNHSDSFVPGSAFAQDISMGDFYRNNIKLLQCPESEGDVSYGLNVMVAGLRIDLVPNASRTVLLADSHFEAISSYVGEDNEAYVEAVEFRHGATWDQGYSISIAAYVDGHIEVFKESDFDMIDGSEDDFSDPNDQFDYIDDDYFDDGDSGCPGGEPNRKRYRRRKREREREREGEGEGEYNEYEHENEYEGGDDEDDTDDDDYDDPDDGCDNGNDNNGNGNDKDKDKGNNGLGNGGEESQGEDTENGEDPSNPAHGDGGKHNDDNDDDPCDNNDDNTDDGDDDGCDNGNDNNGNGNDKDKDKGNNGLGNGGEESQGEDTDKGEDPSNPAHGDDGKSNNGNGNNK